MIDEAGSVPPPHVLCVLGTGLDLDLVARLAAEIAGPDCTLDTEFSRPEPDRRMVASFRSSLTGASFTDADRRSVREHDTVAYLLSPPATRRTAIEVSRRMLALTAALLRNGATAVRNESSGLAHGRDRWLDLADRASAATDEPTLAVVLHRSWVKRPITDGVALYSCGMHLLGAPDVELRAGRPTGPDEVDAQVRLLDALARYLLTEPRAREIRDGETFALAADAPHWVLGRRECARYDPDDLYRNPYGYWCLTPGQPTP
ncbi:hypothetical protein [Plantactinospora endophytica]|uniref:hypothetical protein n=1 Tax=Plantactinospora endophytica TaxID=673535 RepID=UPI001944ACAE|nr:hypothetical protein [Plantactinospora endophytica]